MLGTRTFKVSGDGHRAMNTWAGELTVAEPVSEPEREAPANNCGPGGGLGHRAATPPGGLEPLPAPPRRRCWRLLEELDGVAKLPHSA